MSNNFCGGTNSPRFSWATDVPMVKGNVDPRDHPYNKFLANLPAGTMMVITKTLDPETCVSTCACGLFIKCSPRHCETSVWAEIHPIQTCEEVEARNCEEAEGSTEDPTGLPVEPEPTLEQGEEVKKSGPVASIGGASEQ